MLKTKQQKSDPDNSVVKTQKTEEVIICPNCNQKTDLIWVHGHYQCSICKAVVISCCNGEIVNL